MDEGGQRPQNRAPRAVAWTVVALGMASTAAGLALHVATKTKPLSGYGFGGSDVLIGVSIMLIGAIIVRRRPRNPIGWLWLIAGLLGGGVTIVTAEYAIYSYARHGGDLPFSLFAAWLQQLLWIPTMGAIFLSAHFFPTGRLESSRWRIAAGVTVAGAALFVVPFAVYPGDVAESLPGVVNPIGVSQSTADLMLAIAGALFLAGIGAAVASLIARYRRSRGVERQQIRWLIPALAMTLVMVAANLVSALTGVEGFVADKLIPIITVLSLGMLVGAAGAAILRYRLYDIEIIINRAVIVGVIVVFITVVYVAVVAGVGAAVGSRTGSSVALPIVATAIVGAAFQPVRMRARTLADKVVYGKRATPQEALAGFADVSTVDAFSQRLPRLVVDATAVRSATLWRRTGEELAAVSSAPETTPHRALISMAGAEMPALPGATTVYPLEHHGEPLGVLGVAVGANETLSSDDDRLIRAMAAQASHVLRGLLDAVTLPIGIVTFLMTDIEGSTRLWEQHPEEMADALSQHDGMIRAKVAEEGGVLVKSRGEGDSTFSAFSDPSTAVAAALAVQTAIAARTWSTPQPIRVRASLHTGSAQLRDRDYYGPVINRCARLRAIAHGGQTLVSGATYELTRGSLPIGAEYEDLGVHKLKDLLDEERVYQLNDPRLPAGFPPITTAPAPNSA